MATIRARKKADGTGSNTVQIRLKKKGVLVYQESQTFARKQAAQAWAKRRETELAEPGAIERANRTGHAGQGYDRPLSGRSRENLAAWQDEAADPLGYQEQLPRRGGRLRHFTASAGGLCAVAYES
ncbi:hypothetical protein D3C76_1220220 [compost metagenome]